MEPAQLSSVPRWLVKTRERKDGAAGRAAFGGGGDVSDRGESASSVVFPWGLSCPVWVCACFTPTFSSESQINIQYLGLFQEKMSSLASHD